MCTLVNMPDRTRKVPTTLSIKVRIDKEMKNVERYPNNIQTIIDGTVQLIDIETGESISSFLIYGEFTGGIKAKSLSKTCVFHVSGF